MLKNSSFMLVSTMTRFLAGGILFILMANMWGAELFGTFMYPFALSSLIVLAIDYGFPLQLVRDISATPNRIKEHVHEALSAKIVLSGITILLSIAIAPWFLSFVYWKLFGILLVSGFLSSFAMFFQLPLRGINKFQEETKVTVIYNGLLFGLVAFLLWQGYGPEAVALGFLMSRFLYFFLAVNNYIYNVGKIAVTLAHFSNVPLILKRGFSFGVHTALGTLYFQIDTLIIQYFLGADGVGVYQGGIRLFIAALIFADVLASVYLVSMSATREPAKLINLGRQMTRYLLTIGSVGFIIMISWADPIVSLIYGSDYTELTSLLPYFGLALLVRYGVYSYSVILTVAELQNIRAIGGLLALTFNIVLNFFLIPLIGLKGAVFTVIATNILLGLLYIPFSTRALRDHLIDTRSLIIIGIGAFMGMLSVTRLADQFILPTIFISLVLLFGFKRQELRRITSIVLRT